LQLQLQFQNQLQLQFQNQLVTVATSVAVAAVRPVAITIKVFLRIGNDYHCYQMEPLPANAIRGMYLHIFNG
jgi:hypothetical protein